MINHARTLLLNVAGSPSGFPGGPGEEFIPPDFRPSVLPRYLRELRAYLFGRAPDRLMLNYRIRQLLAPLHASELTEYLTQLDPRITYGFDDHDLYSLPVVAFRAINGTTAAIYQVGEPREPDASGICLRRWRVHVLDSGRVRLTTQLGPALDTTVDYETTDGLSEPVTLPGDTWQVRFAAVSGAQWVVESIARPQRSLGEIVAAVDAGGQGNLIPLFGHDTGEAQREPYQTFWALWKIHPELPYRLIGLLLAMIYRLEGLRQGGAQHG